MNFDFPTAEDSARKAKEGAGRVAREQLTEIRAAVEAAVDKNERSTCVGFIAIPAVLEFLRAKKYTVTTDSFRNEQTTSISW